VVLVVVVDGTGGGTGSGTVVLVVVVAGTGGGTGSGTVVLVVVVAGTGGGTGSVVLVLVVVTDDESGGRRFVATVVVVTLGGSGLAPEDGEEPDGISEPSGEPNHGVAVAAAGDVPDDSGVNVSAVLPSRAPSPPPEGTLIGSPVSTAATSESTDDSTAAPPLDSPLRERANTAAAPTTTTTMITTDTERPAIPTPRVFLGCITSTRLLVLSRVVLGNAPQHHHLE
jgi:hypothetical protein